MIALLAILLGLEALGQGGSQKQGSKPFVYQGTGTPQPVPGLVGITSTVNPPAPSLTVPIPTVPSTVTVYQNTPPPGSGATANTVTTVQNTVTGQTQVQIVIPKQSNIPTPIILQGATNPLTGQLSLHR
jgi:hypothetical protein